MAEPIPFEEQAEALKLRAKPKPVTQINRKVVITAACIGCVLLFLAASIALDPPKVSGKDEPRELYNTRNKPTADALAALPASYDQVRPVAVDAPALGPALSGDLGATFVQTERELGLQPDPIAEPVYDFRPDPASEAERAERIRQAKLAQESLESPVFFQVQGGQRSAPAPRETPQPVDPFAALTEATAAFAGGGALPAGPASRDANLQSSKIAFAADVADASIYNSYRIVEPASPYQVMAGTIIPASLITGLNSDLPGTIIAQVTQPVYDTVSGAHLLIPQGARLIGRYDSQVSFGQDRALVVWDRVLFPNGASIQIDALPGADQSGYAGLSDKVDNHWGRVFTAAGLASLLGIGTELAVDSNDEIANAVRDSFQDTANQAGQRVVDRNLNIQPTLKVRPGWPLRVIVTRDLILRPYE
ncbi:TrbI/VirB10 family protein [Hyphomonas sp. CY54-11-8]|uniref:TrbI/VirB10 family protein n=1 Tax=Hyphomonas sp. CY54-11-8 TaxID=1280944 RepID=UPI000458EDC2|nr:TrbI/VirB10 family protein [Hyphomonas sp. CY54-11-8]KCZ48499.1 hypothetical protein HY17_16755 [Hyphomonas sp. CY54-11-8]